MQLLRSIFDFDALRSLLTGTNGYKKFNVLFDSMNGGAYRSIVFIYL